MKKDIQILIVDDHQVVRDGLQHMLEQEKDLEVVGQSADREETLSQIEKLSPNIVLMDIKMPGVDGLELTRQLKQKQPSCNVIMLTLYDEYLTRAIESGAKGYLLKDIKREELVRAIRAAHQGRSPINLSISQEHLAELTNSDENRQRLSLSKRELAILQLLAEGATTKELASQLFLSPASIKRSIKLIFEKLDVRKRYEAVAEACKRGLI